MAHILLPMVKQSSDDDGSILINTGTINDFYSLLLSKRPTLLESDLDNPACILRIVDDDSLKAEVFSWRILQEKIMHGDFGSYNYAILQSYIEPKSKVSEFRIVDYVVKAGKVLL